MHRMNSLFVRVIYSRFMLCQWSFLGLSAVLFLASCFAGWRAFAVMVLAYGATLCLIHSFQLGNVPYRLQPKRRFRAPPFELSCGHGWSGPLVFSC